MINPKIIIKLITLISIVGLISGCSNQTTSNTSNNTNTQSISSETTQNLVKEKALDFHIISVENIAGRATIYFQVTNNSFNNIFVSPLDFTLSSSKDGNTIKPTKIFDGITLQYGQSAEESLVFTQYQMENYNILNYNGIKEKQQIPISISKF